MRCFKFLPVLLFSLLLGVSAAPRPAEAGLNGRLVGLLSKISRHYGRPVTITSGCRSFASNRRAGGRRHSLHLRCMAADIRVRGVSEVALLRFVRVLPGRGGVGTYCRNSVVHVDVGPRREWHEGCGGSFHAHRHGKHHMKHHARHHGHKKHRKHRRRHH